MKASTGGPTRIAKRISARVRAERVCKGLSMKRQQAAVATDASALMVSSDASTREIPSSSYMTSPPYAAVLASFL